MKKLVKLVAVLGILMSTLVVLTGCGSKPYKKVLDKLYKAEQNGDADAIVKLFPKFMDMSSTFSDEVMEKRLDSLKEVYGDDVKITYEVTESEKLDKDDKEKWEEYIEEQYDENVKIQDAYKVSVEVKYKGSEGSGTEDEQMGVVKIKGKWYLFV